MSRSLRREPTNANTWNDLGVVRLAADRPREALVAFSRALEINAAHTDALNNKAGALRRMTLFTEALPLQKRLVSLRPHSPDALVNLAESLYYTGNVAGAIEHYRTALWLSLPTHSGAAWDSVRLAKAWVSSNRLTSSISRS